MRAEYDVVEAAAFIFLKQGRALQVGRSDAVRQDLYWLKAGT